MLAGSLGAQGVEIHVTLHDLVTYPDLLEQWSYILQVQKGMEDAGKPVELTQAGPAPTIDPTSELADLLNDGVAVD